MIEKLSLTVAKKIAIRNIWTTYVAMIYRILAQDQKVRYLWYIIYTYIYIYVSPVGVTSLYRVLNYRAMNKWVGFQIKKNNFFGT